MRALRLAAGLLALAAIATWNAFLAWTVGAGDRPSPTDDGATADEATADPAVIEHERNWYDYLRGFHAHHGDVAGDHPEQGSFWAGLDLWLGTRCLCGYTLGDHTYVCSNAPPGTPGTPGGPRALVRPAVRTAADRASARRRSEGRTAPDAGRDATRGFPPHAVQAARPPRSR